MCAAETLDEQGCDLLHEFYPRQKRSAARGNKPNRFEPTVVRDLATSFRKRRGIIVHARFANVPGLERGELRGDRGIAGKHDEKANNGRMVKRITAVRLGHESHCQPVRTARPVFVPLQVGDAPQVRSP
jgi:hypothetical protein